MVPPHLRDDPDIRVQEDGSLIRHAIARYDPASWIAGEGPGVRLLGGGADPSGQDRGPHGASNAATDRGPSHPIDTRAEQTPEAALPSGRTDTDRLNTTPGDHHAVPTQPRPPEDTLDVNSARLKRLQEEWGIEIDTATAPPRQEKGFGMKAARAAQDFARDTTVGPPTVPDEMKGEVADILEDLKGYQDMSEDERGALRNRIAGLGSGDPETAVLRNRLDGVARALRDTPWRYPAGLSDQKIRQYIEAFERVEKTSDDVGAVAGMLGDFAKGTLGRFGGPVGDMTAFAAEQNSIHYLDLLDRLYKERDRRARTR
jgi:hypothetical protein